MNSVLPSSPRVWSEYLAISSRVISFFAGSFDLKKDEMEATRFFISAVLLSTENSTSDTASSPILKPSFLNAFLIQSRFWLSNISQNVSTDTLLFSVILRLILEGDFSDDIMTNFLIQIHVHF